MLFVFMAAGAPMASDQVVVRRAAFDIGSAVIKCTVADVDIVSGTILKKVEQFSRKADFEEDISRSYDGNFSREIMAQGMDALRELKLKAIELGARDFSAVGGAAFRNARNGRAYFVTIGRELGIPARIISKQQASLLSYQAVALHQGIPASELLVWDIGGGGQQMTARRSDGSLSFYIDNLASVTFKNAVIEMIQGLDIKSVHSPNPMSEDEVRRALEYAQSYALMSVPPELAGRIKSGIMHVYGIGGVHYYAVPELVGQRKSSYTRAEVEQAVSRWTGKADEAFESEYASSRLTNLILVLGYMNALDIDTVMPLKIDQTDGLLVTREFW